MNLIRPEHAFDLETPPSRLAAHHTLHIETSLQLKPNSNGGAGPSSPRDVSDLSPPLAAREFDSGAETGRPCSSSAQYSVAEQPSFEEITNPLASR